MSKTLVVKQNDGLATPVRHQANRLEVVSGLGSSARRYLRSKHSKNTQNSYQSDARMFTEWCFLKGIEPVGASTAVICDFLADQADGYYNRWVWTDKANKLGYLSDGQPLAYATIYRRLNGVKFALQQRGRSFDEAELAVLKEMMQGIANENGTEKKKVKGITPEHLKKIFSLMDLKDHVHLRDRALLMLLYAGAFRRSELSALDVSQVKMIEGKGMEIRLNRAKRKINGMTKSIASGGDLCPVRFLQEYMDSCEIESGPLFRRTNRSRKMTDDLLADGSIAQIVKEWCKAAGIEGRFGGHSGRRGFVDTAVRAGKPINKVMEMTGHKSIQTVQEYFDEGERWRDNASSGLY